MKQVLHYTFVFHFLILHKFLSAHSIDSLSESLLGSFQVAVLKIKPSNFSKFLSQAINNRITCSKTSAYDRLSHSLSVMETQIGHYFKTPIILRYDKDLTNNHTHKRGVKELVICLIKVSWLIWSHTIRLKIEEFSDWFNHPLLIYYTFLMSCD